MVDTVKSVKFHQRQINAFHIFHCHLFCCFRLSCIFKLLYVFHSHPPFLVMMYSTYDIWPWFTALVGSRRPERVLQRNIPPYPPNLPLGTAVLLIHGAEVAVSAVAGNTCLHVLKNQSVSVCTVCWCVWLFAQFRQKHCSLSRDITTNSSPSSVCCPVSECLWLAVYLNRVLFKFGCVHVENLQSADSSVAFKWSFGNHKGTFMGLNMAEMKNILHSLFILLNVCHVYNNYSLSIPWTVQ